MPQNSKSRYAQVSRRAMLKRSAALGAALVLPGVACGNEVADSLSDVSTGGEAASDAAANRTADTSPTADPGTAVETVEPAAESVAPADSGSAPGDSAPAEPTSPAAATEPPAAPGSGMGAVPAGAEVVVGFTYTQGAGGKNLPPYIAVWVEDVDGELVETIALWFQQDKKGPRWLPDLKRWFRKEEAFVAAGGVDETDIMSSATRLAGSHTVAWDLMAPAGVVPTGDYFICIEASRERGPYSLIRAPMVIDGSPFVLDLPADEELSDATVSLQA